jgi:hypothetical protein
MNRRKARPIFRESARSFSLWKEKKSRLPDFSKTSCPSPACSVFRQTEFGRKCVWDLAPGAVPAVRMNPDTGRFGAEWRI